MLSEIPAAIQSLQFLTTGIKTLATLTDKVAANDKLIEVQNTMIQLQSQLMLIQAQFQKLEEEKQQLCKELEKAENWDQESKGWEIALFGTGNAVCIRKGTGKDGAEAPIASQEQQKLCANCFGEKKIIYLAGNGENFICPRCKMVVSIW